MQPEVDVHAPIADWPRWPAGPLRLVRRLGAEVHGRLAQEAERWILWAPVAIVVGVWLFFQASAPPDPWLLAPAAALAGVSLAGASRHRDLTRAALVGLALACIGWAAACVRVATVDGMLLDRPVTTRLEGTVLTLAPTEKGARLILGDLAGERLPQGRPLVTVSLAIRRAEDVHAGDRVRLLARLQPPSPPLLPGAFDFARNSWFQEIGAVGFALGKVEVVSRASGGSLAARVGSLRETMTRRIAEPFPGDAGQMSAAMVTGLQAGISDEVWRDMQRSGLAHLISISGLHMTMVASTLFLLLRYGLALVPALALRVPAKKLAAIGGIAGVTFYYLVSGMSVPAQRSWLMCVAGFLAVLADRNPLSLRVLAAAASFILLWRPESLLGPSFQLSFAAMLALLAANEARPRTSPSRDSSAWLLPFRYAVGVVVTTMIASLATAPLSALHFQSIATYSVLANLLAVPITSFVVMPAGMLATALMPVGLERAAVEVMVGGTQAVLMVAHAVASLPGAAVPVSVQPAACLGLAALGGLWLGLWRTAWRYLGILPLVASLLVALLARPPDLLVHPTFDLVALREADGTARLLERDRDAFVRDAWMRGLGASALTPFPPAQAGAAAGLACDPAGCTLLRDGRSVTLATRADAVLEDCVTADLVVAAVGPERCAGAGRLIGPRALRRSDGIAVRVTPQGVTVETVASRRGRWPWTWEGSHAPRPAPPLPAEPAMTAQ